MSKSLLMPQNASLVGRLHSKTQEGFLALHQEMSITAIEPRLHRTT